MSTKILLADDSITIQKVIGIIFGGEEYSLTVVDNGKAAIDRALEVLPDILLIDALMPGMTGYEVCERIRATPELAAKPILLLTGSFEPFDENKARQCGADDFIAKPFESQQIINKVTELCEQSALRSFEPTVTSAEEQPAPFEAAEPVVAADILPQESILPPNNIWDAFTTAAEESPLAPLADEAGASPFAVAEPEAVSSPWVPIDEQSFQFEEESAADIPAPSFGESSQESEFAFAAPPAIDAPPVPPVAPEPIISPETPVAAPPVAPQRAEDQSQAPILSEEQLKAALASVSRDVIEKVVWEVVPDLAEVMIREAIRRIKEGVAEA